MVFATLVLVLCIVAGGVNASQCGSWRTPIERRAQQSWSLQKFTSLVTFGDSYTDEGRLTYMIYHKGQVPPVGWVQPPSDMTASGGTIWPRFVQQSTGVNLYNYAVGGAACSNKLTPRVLPLIGRRFPAVGQYELSAFLAESAYRTPDGEPFLQIPPDETVYALWIGTNDVGANGYLTDSQVAGTTMADYVDCVYRQLDRLYAAGARHFVLMNLAPLQLAPLYATPENSGVTESIYWIGKPQNLTQASYRMAESVALLNDIYAYRTPYEFLIKRRYPGANVANFDVNALITDIYNDPHGYLGFPANVTGFQNHCPLDGGKCTKLPNPDTFLWYDELHPSEQTERVIASAFEDVVGGRSKYATYYC